MVERITVNLLVAGNTIWIMLTETRLEYFPLDDGIFGAMKIMKDGDCNGL